MKRTNIKRVSQVVSILSKHGLGYFLQEYGLDRHLPFVTRVFSVQKKHEDVPVRLRKAMEEIGGASIKLGQLLSLRPDMIPPEWCNEFKKLLDETPPASYEQIRRVIEAEFKKPINKIFSSFDRKPIGSASIAQVHLAKLHTGQKVVVKVQRPGTKEKFSSDIEIMYYLARKIDPYIINHARPLDIVEEFERYTKKELDFTNEARSADKFYKNFKNSKTTVIPKIYWQYTTPKVMVMQYLEGTKLSELSSIPSEKRKKIARAIADTMFKQAMEDGYFHADLHPGNIILMPGDKIGLLDFGITCELDETLKKLELDMYLAVVNKDVKEIIRVLLKEGMPTEETDMEAFKLDAENIIDEWYDAELKAARVTNMMYHLFNNCVKHKIKMPTNLILLGKGLLTAESTCMWVDPEFDFLEYSRPILAGILRKQKRPDRLIKTFMSKSQDMAYKMSQLPGEALDLIDQVKHGAIKVDMAYTDIRHVGMDINKSSNRMSYAMIIAALVVAGALLVEIQPAIYGYSIFSIVSLTGAGLLILMLFASILREGKPRYDPHKNEKIRR